MILPHRANPRGCIFGNDNGSCAIQPLKIRDETKWRAAALYVHAKISPENTKTTDNLHITLAQLVLGSYELEAAEKA